MYTSLRDLLRAGKSWSRSTDRGGDQVQRLKLPAQFGWAPGTACPAGGGDYGFLENPTRGEKNDQAAFPGRTEGPSLLTPGGFYQGSVTVEAGAPEGAFLRYTTDGATPTAKTPGLPGRKPDLQEDSRPAHQSLPGREESLSETVSAQSYSMDDDPQTPMVSLISGTTSISSAPEPAS